ncbi:MAG: B12-binding domain-containing radical SAM protein [Clostridiales bacterium]|nr:B12-binding domain-containing radical SAM protein [Clostridiales bacterium]
MHIVFITPAAALRRFPVYRLGSRFYGHPNAITGPLILGGILKRAGHTVEVYEELNGRLPLKKYLREADVFSIYTMTSTAPRAYELADIIHACSEAKVIIGGIHASALPEEAAAHADQVIVGEGESVILDVVEGRMTDRIIRTDPPQNLDALPLPDYSILKTPCDAANIMTTRGCTYRCTFCTTSRMFAPYRQRSVDSVIDEIRMYKKMGFRYMNFEDDNFTADKERAKEICRRMIEEDLTFKETFFFGRTDMANDEELMALLEKAHLNRVLIGIESLNEKALEQIHKGQHREDIIRAAESCRRHKIRLIASIVLGLDADTKNDIRKAVRFAKNLDAYQLQPAVLTPYPGTPVYQQFNEECRMLVPDWEQYDMMNVTFRPANMSPWELQDEFYRAVTHFYTFRSSFRIGKIFGWGYAVRRLGLAFFSKAGAFGARFAADYAKKTFYYKLKHNVYQEAQDKNNPVLYQFIKELPDSASGSGNYAYAAANARNRNKPAPSDQTPYDDSTTHTWKKEQLIS